MNGSGSSSSRMWGSVEALEPSPLELIPLMGADALVFLYGGTAIKIFMHEVRCGWKCNETPTNIITFITATDCTPLADTLLQ